MRVDLGQGRVLQGRGDRVRSPLSALIAGDAVGSFETGSDLH